MKNADVEDIYELSPLQQGMHFHVLYEPESRLYFEQILLPFEGFVNADAFAAAWNSVVARHDALRASFHWKQTEKPFQVIHSKVTVPIEIKDLRNTRDQETQTAALLAADRERGFDIQRAPLPDAFQFPSLDSGRLEPAARLPRILRSVRGALSE